MLNKKKLINELTRNSKSGENEKLISEEKNKIYVSERNAWRERKKKENCRWEIAKEAKKKNEKLKWRRNVIVISVYVIRTRYYNERFIAIN